MTRGRVAALRQLRRPLLWGHRGSRAGLPENTLAAIDAAADAGADGVEVDARRCRSGELVLVHDESLTRITAGRDRRQVDELDYRELQQVELDAGHRIPPLGEVMTHCRHRHLALNVELKVGVAGARALARATARLLRRHELPHVLLASSFDPRVLGWLRAACPDLPVALLVEHARPWSLGVLTMAALAAHGIHPDKRLVSAAWVRRWHRLGLRVATWTVNDPTEAAELLALGVDDLISDDPATIRDQVVAAHGTRTSVPRRSPGQPLNGSRRTAAGRLPARAD